MRDITVRKQLMAQLEALSETDLLTGVLNRRGFMKLASREFERARRAGRKLAVVMLDLDHFKAVNDRWAAGGYWCGDGREEAAGRSATSIFSVGSAERNSRSCLWTAGWMPPRSCSRVCAKPLQGRKSRRSRATLRSASFGMAVIDPGLVDVEVALRLADEALYEAKNAGRNCSRIRAYARSCRPNLSSSFGRRWQ